MHIIGIVEDEVAITKPLSTFLNMLSDYDLAIVNHSVEDFLKHTKVIKTLDMLLLDISIEGGMSGLDGIPGILAINPKIDIIMLTASTEAEDIYTALERGAVSYIIKNLNLKAIKNALDIVASGGSYMSPSIARKVVHHFKPTAKNHSKEKIILTKRQTEIVNDIANGLSYKMIAARLNISIETVRDHIKKIYKKLNVNSKAEVIQKKFKGEI